MTGRTTPATLEIGHLKKKDSHRNCKYLASRFCCFFTLNVSFPEVSFHTFVSPLASSMMAPGLPDIALRYGIASPTIVGLVLSVFLLDFGLGIGVVSFYPQPQLTPFNSPCDRSFI